MFYDASWWSVLADEFVGAKLEELPNGQRALLFEYGAADVAVVGSMGAECTVCVSFAAVQDPLAIKEALLKDDDFVRAVSPYTKKLTKRLRLAAGQAWLFLPSRCDGEKNKASDVISVVKSFAQVLTRRAPVAQRRCGHCCDGEAKLVLIESFPLRICQSCEENKKKVDAPQLDGAEIGHLHPGAPPKSTEKEALQRDELSYDNLGKLLDQSEAAYEDWLYKGLFLSITVAALTIAALVFMLMSHLQVWAIALVAFALLLSVTPVVIYAIIFARAHSFLEFRHTHPAQPADDLTEEQRESVEPWLKEIIGELDLHVDQIIVNDSFDLSATVCRNKTSDERAIVLELGAPLILALPRQRVDILLLQQLFRAKVGKEHKEEQRQGHIFALAITFGYVEMWLLSSPMGPLLEPLFRHFGEYLFEYQALLRSLQRKLEFRADALIVEKVGADTFTNALAGVLLDGHLVDVALDEWRRRSSAKEELDVETLSEILKEGLTKVNEETRRDLYDILFSDEALWTDSLPSLKNRIEVHKVKLKEPPKALPGGDTKLPSSLFTKDLEKMVNAFGPSFSFSRKVRNNGMDWRESIQELLEDSPQSPALYALLAEASGAACDDEGAAKAVRRVVEMDGENTLARTRLLSWSLRLGQMGEAAWNVSTLLEQAPDDKPFYWLENVTPQPWTTVTYAHSRLVLARLVTIVQAVLKEQNRTGLLRSFYDKLRRTMWNMSPRTDAYILAKARLIGSAASPDRRF